MILLGCAVLWAIGGKTPGEAASSQTAVLTFAPVADARVHEASPTSNYGTRIVLRVDGVGDPGIDSYLRFAVTGVVGTVQRATLRLRATTDTADGPSVSGTGSDWTETGLTWNNRPPPSTAAVDDAGPIQPATWVELDVTPLVPMDGTYSFLVAATSKDGVDFDSREAVDPTVRPQLVVELVETGAPVAISPPAISGISQDGRTLTGSDGVWNGSQPITLDRQWQRCDASGASCAALPGEVGSTYLVGAADVGSTLRFAVSATNGGGSSVATSDPSGVVIGSGDVRTVVAGDIAGCSWNTDETTAQLIDAIAPNHVLTLGDNAYPDGSAAEFNGCYGSSWGRHIATTFPSVGNHEYHQPGASGYFGYFGAAAGDPAEGYYVVQVGAWRLYALNSNCLEVPCTAGSAQEQWLRQDLAAHPGGCVLAFWHHARFSSGWHGGSSSTSGLWQALYDAGADVILQGHDHDYERFTRLTPTGVIDLAGGVRSFVVGTGGAGLTAFPGVPTPGSEQRSSTHGVLTLTLRADGYDWEFVPAPGASFTDAGSDTCGAALQDTTPPTAPASLTSPSATPGNVELQWAPAADDVGVISYDVHRDGGLIATTTGTTYPDLSAVGGSTYEYSVTARDAAGNVSGPSNILTVTVAPATSSYLFAPEADARVMEARPGKNFGGDPSLRTDGGSDPDVESYLRFTVSGVTGQIQRAVLRLFAYSATVDGPAVSGAGNAWTESSITWSSRTAATTQALADTGTVPRNTWVELDVTTHVPGNGSYSFVLTTTSTDQVDFYSRESSQITLRPQLVITSG